MRWIGEAAEIREGKQRRLEAGIADLIEHAAKAETGVEDYSPEWVLPPQFTTTVHVGDFLVDAEIRHALRPGSLHEEDYPEVVTIHRLVRFDGEPLGAKAIRIDLRTVAVDAVIKASRLVMVPNSDGVYGIGGPTWRDAARLVRRLASDIGGFRWTPEKDEFLVDTWRHFHETGHGTQTDLADELGLDTKRISDRLRLLRKKWGEEKVPEGRRGRPRRVEQ
jgi:hypothetical protein